MAVGERVGNVFTPFHNANAAIQVIVIADGIQIILIGDAIHIKVKNGCTGWTRAIFIHQGKGGGSHNNARCDDGNKSADKRCFSNAEISAQGNVRWQRCALQISTRKCRTELLRLGAAFRLEVQGERGGGKILVKYEWRCHSGSSFRLFA